MNLPKSEQRFLLHNSIFSDIAYEFTDFVTMTNQVNEIVYMQLCSNLQFGVECWMPGLAS